LVLSDKQMLRDDKFDATETPPPKLTTPLTANACLGDCDWNPLLEADSEVATFRLYHTEL